MSKAVQGVAMLGGAVALGAVSFALASTGVGFAALPFLAHGMEFLALGGISMLAGAAASALTSNRGSNITVRQAAAYRQIIYGTQRVGGTMIYQSTTGSNHDNVNYVIVLAGHVCDSLPGLYLDGRKVYWQVGSVGNHTQNGVNFGGTAAGGSHTGPGGASYDFGGMVYAQAYYGDQTNQPNTTPGGGYDTGLHANDGVWGPSPEGLPYVGGCTYIYFKYRFNSEMFPQPPEIRVTVRGKCNIYDPRTGTRGFTNNWALVLADVFHDSQFGLGAELDEVYHAQTIAAANICDEMVPLAAGGFEKRYCSDDHYDTSTEPGAAIARMMPAAAGRFTRSGGKWYLWPAAWQGPSFQFDENALAADFDGASYRERRDLVNRITGTYTAPNYPYNATTEHGSNLYDANGFYDGTIENNFGMAFQASSFPYFAEDVRHGYPTNQHLNEDSGVTGEWTAGVSYPPGVVVSFNGLVYRSISTTSGIPPVLNGALEAGFWENAPNVLTRDLALPSVLSISQAQRVAKIVLRRNRQQGGWVLPMFPAAFAMSQMDVMQFSMAFMGWVDKDFEVGLVTFGTAPGKNGVPTPQVRVAVNETAASVYEWDASEELDIYVAPVAQTVSFVPGMPENVLVTSSAATAIHGLDGIAHPRALVSFDQPHDGLVKQVEVQVAGPIGTGSPAFRPAGIVGVAAGCAYVSDLIAGAVYSFRARSVRGSGAVSPWVEIDGVTISLTLSQVGQAGVGIGSLYADGLTNGTAEIVCNPFSARVGGATVALFPSGPVTITGLAQGRTYWVYYVDPVFAGGDVTPIATQDQTDFLGKQGYFLIDSTVTPVVSGSGGGSGGGAGTGGRFYPTQPHDVGDRSSQMPFAAFDKDAATFATVSGTAFSEATRIAGYLLLDGFPPITTSADLTLTCVLSAVTYTDASAAGIDVVIAGTKTNYPLAAGSQTFTSTIPGGTPLDTVSVGFAPDPQYTPEIPPVTIGDDPTPGSPGNAFIRVAEVYIQ